MKLAISGQILCHKYPRGPALEVMRQLECDALEVWPTCLAQGAFHYRDCGQDSLKAAEAA